MRGDAMAYYSHQGSPNTQQANDEVVTAVQPQLTSIGLNH